MMIRLPYASDNGVWLKRVRQPPHWSQPFQCWLAPKAWFDDVISRALQRFGRVYVIEPFREREKCASLCWNARGFDCECSCMGKNHGVNAPSGGWDVPAHDSKRLGPKFTECDTFGKLQGNHHRARAIRPGLSSQQVRTARRAPEEERPCHAPRALD